VTAWCCEFAPDTGCAGFLRLDLRADENIAWFWTYLVDVPDVDGIVAVRDHEVPLPRQGLEIRAEGLWAELWCETPNEHWTFGLEAFGIRLDDADDALRPGGEIGERVAVGLDLEWETGEAGGIVHGDVLVGRARVAIDGWGRFVEDHGLRDDVVAGEPVARVLIPLGDDAVCERTLVRTPDGARRWSQVIRVGCS
jgi:hypothetical protein